MRKVCWLLGGALALSLSGTIVDAQNETTGNGTAAAGPANAAPKAQRNGDIRISNSQNGTASYDTKRGISIITGDVRVTQVGEDFILYADKIVYNENTNQAEATGRLKVETRDSTIVGLKMRANFDTKVITITDKVEMRSHGTDDGIKGSASSSKKRSIRGDVTGKASRMTCDRIDFNYDIREAVITGNIRMMQGKNEGTCDTIVFDEENNIAELRGNVRFTNGERQTFRSQKVIIWLDEDKMHAPSDTKQPTTIVIPPKKSSTPSQARTNFPAPPSDNIFDFEETPATPAPAGNKPAEGKQSQVNRESSEASERRAEAADSDKSDKKE